MADDKKFFIKVLKVIGAFSSAAGMFCPISAMAGSIIQVVANSIDDEEIENLKEKFEAVKQGLNEISVQIKQTQLQIDRLVCFIQYDEIVQKIRKHYSDFMELMEPGDFEGKKQAFIKSYEDEKGTSNINILYRGVVEDQAFNLPLLQVPEENSDKDAICSELINLFSIGVVTVMGYYACIGDDVPGRKMEWEKKLNKVTEKMEAYLMD